jgi:hypothetical protein
MEFKLEGDVYLVLSEFDNKKVVHIRKYATKTDGSGKYPTKIGICLSPKRFVSLITNFEQIGDAYEYVSKTEGEWRTVHIGGELYASVSSDYKCINLRHFFRSPDTNKAIPGQPGIALTLPTWRKLKLHAVELREADEDLKNATLCMMGTDHANQMGFFECPECVPFVGPFYSAISGDEETTSVELPPTYYSDLKCAQAIPHHHQQDEHQKKPPAKKMKKTVAVAKRL